MSDDLKWDPKKKEERDAARAKQEERDKLLFDTRKQKQAFLNQYESWKRRLAKARRTPEQLEYALKDLRKKLDEIVTHPSLASWKIFAQSLISEKIFMVKDFSEASKSGGAEPSDPAGPTEPADPATGLAPEPKANPRMLDPDAGPADPQPPDPRRN